MLINKYQQLDVARPQSTIDSTLDVARPQSTDPHKLFGAKTKATKVKYRKKDEELRNEIADILKKDNLPVESAEQLASWDPYDQNGVSPFLIRSGCLMLKMGLMW